MLLALFFLLYSDTIDPPTTYDGRAGKLAVRVPRLEVEPAIDGKLDEQVWGEAALLTGFSQFSPADGVPAADSTEVLGWYSPTAILFGIRAFEAHGAVHASLAETGSTSGNGFNNAMVRRERADLSPDFVFQSKGRVTEYGYEVEVRIPFKSLRFQPKLEQSWGITNNLTLNGTANPDFSQVESDAQQFSFDPRQEIFFSEKRPFFLDGIEQFTTPNQLIYTRRIIQPVAAAKLTGKAFGTDLALLTAVDDRPARPAAKITRSTTCSGCSGTSAPSRGWAWSTPTRSTAATTTGWRVPTCASCLAACTARSCSRPEAALAPSGQRLRAALIPG